MSGAGDPITIWQSAAVAMSLRVGLLSCLLFVAATAGVNGGRHGDPLWKPNMGSYSMPITTASAECQSRFDLGVLCEFNFNQGFAQAQFNASLDVGVFLGHFSNRYIS